VSDEHPDSTPDEEEAPALVPEAPQAEPTFWEGEPCEARQVSVVVADDSRFAAYWAHGLIGERRNAVEVTQKGRTFYIDDEPFVGRQQPGWEKVTVGRGMPDHGHRELAVEPESIEEREQDLPGEAD
jgi:hypothetical protein